ncbi:MAG: M42 family metallopeptidase, partial [Flammeovirgaceae bacterium]|nr:M42 family metallopeptidase [Flammeovirgaceae bacterium]
MNFLRQLCEVRATSGNEKPMKDFLLAYIKKEKKNWKVQPKIIQGDHIQDCILLVFGKPRTAILAHMDSIGFTVRYQNQLVPIGSPEAEAGTLLVGEDSRGPIECSLEFDSDNRAQYKFGRAIDRGTELTYKVNYREDKNFIESAYLDNRLGVYVALQIAAKLKDGIIAFTCWEEHGGGSVPFLADLLFKKWKVRQALISDITWDTDGVEIGKGVVISMRDRNIPRRQYINRITEIANKSNIPYQLEVEGMGSSDGGELQ